jgi:chemotaxis protein MotD
MNRLDLLSQTMPRHVDTQSRNASVTQDALEGNGGPGTSDFGSFLEGISGKAQKDAVATSRQDAGLLNAEADKSNPPSEGSETDSLQALLPDASSGDGSAAASALPSGSPVFSILENLLPRILTRTANVGNADTGQSGPSLTSAYSSLLQQDMDEANLVNAGHGSKLAAVVQNQEAHFRPIIEGLSNAPTEPGAAASVEDSGSTPQELLAGKLKGAESQGLPPSKRDDLTQSIPDMTAEAEPTRRLEEQRLAGKVASDRTTDPAEMQKQSQTSGPKTDASSLPSSTLQHLANSIVDDAKGLSDPHRASFQQDGLNRVAMAKASGSVLRVLDLQLKPAELGLVTIRMRLAGDGLEMEILAENEETAELLRNDAEKLSNLLRVSGYRPDVINIQSTEATSHDRSSFQRPQQGSQEGQSFQQGAASGQGNSSRHREDRYGSGGAEARMDSKEDRRTGGSPSGGIYL